MFFEEGVLSLRTLPCASSNCRYAYQKQRNVTEDGMFYTGFDLLVLCGRTEIYRVEDVFLTETVAQEFVNRCNCEQLELCHLADVLEDRLCDFPL